MDRRAAAHGSHGGLPGTAHVPGRLPGALPGRHAGRVRHHRPGGGAAGQQLSPGDRSGRRLCRSGQGRGPPRLQRVRRVRGPGRLPVRGSERLDPAARHVARLHGRFGRHRAQPRGPRHPGERPQALSLPAARTGDGGQLAHLRRHRRAAGGREPHRQHRGARLGQRRDALDQALRRRRRPGGAGAGRRQRARHRRADRGRKPDRCPPGLARRRHGCRVHQLRDAAGRGRHGRDPQAGGHPGHGVQHLPDPEPHPARRHAAHGRRGAVLAGPDPVRAVGRVPGLDHRGARDPGDHPGAADHRSPHRSRDPAGHRGRERPRRQVRAHARRLGSSARIRCPRCRPIRCGSR